MEKANSNSDARQNIRVFVRVRPALPLESSSRSILQCTADNEVTVKDNNKGKISDRTTKTFRFNQVFNPQATQAEVFENVVEPLLEEVLQGYSCTVFAYGQTGTGKTFTMEGERSSSSSWTLDSNSGIIPRTLSELFDRLRLKDVDYAVRISFLELYNEELIDLLSPPDDTTRLRLFEDSSKKGAVIISGLQEVDVCTKTDVYKILEKGSMKRQTASTLMNVHSSRSHTVFTATLYIREKAENIEGEEVVRTGKINLVDLAGSENIGRSGAIDMRAREAGNINQSLLTLGRVITALVDQSPHIPYRESKLTRLLQESLGGRTKTSIIATVSPALCNYEETLSTLEYAHRAKNIQNKPEVNKRFSKKLHLTEYAEEFKRLHCDLEATRQRTGVYLDSSEYEEMLRRLNAFAEESNEKMEQIKALQEEIARQEALCDELNAKLHLVDAAVQEKEAALAAEMSTLREVQSEVDKTRFQEREQTHLIAKHWQTAQKLKSQATQLKSVAEESSTKSVLLHDKLQSVRAVTVTNENLGVDMQVKVSQSISSGLDLIDIAAKEEADQLNGLKTRQGSGLNSFTDKLKAREEALKMFVVAEGLVIDNARKIARDQAEFETAWVAELRDAISKGMRSSASVNNWQTDVARPILRKQQEQMIKMQEDVTNIFSKTSEADVWRVEYLQIHDDLISRRFLILLEEKLPALKSESKVIDDVKAITSALKEEHSTFSKNLLAEVSKATKSLQAAQLLSKGWREALSAKQAGISDNVVKYSKGAESLKHSVQDFLTQANAEVLHNKNHYSQHIVTYCSETSNCISEWDSSDQLGVLPSTTQEIVESARATWQEQRSVTALLIEKANSERIVSTDLLDKCRQEMKTLVEEYANKNAAGLDEMSSHVSDLSDEVETWMSKHNESVKTWTTSLDEIVSDCHDRVRGYVDGDFKQSVPTGETPQRGTISYPRDLPATSPHERILGRLREKMLLTRMSSEDECTDTPSDSSNPASLLSVDTSSNTDKNLRNKENSLRESPLKNPGKKLNCRKPLVSQNGTRQ